MRIVPEKCKKCLQCVEVCPVGAISRKGEVVVIDSDKCLSCGCCVSSCLNSAIEYE